MANNHDFKVKNGLNVTGNITVGGTVDGRNLTSDGNKLDGVSTGAEANPSASSILTSIKTVDGVSSGLDSDLLDGQHGSYYTGYTDDAIAALIDSSPGTLNTLNELAAALGDDASFSTTVTNSIATKLPLTGGTITGHLGIGGTATDASWGDATYGNTEVSIDGGGGYGVLHFRGDGAGSSETRYSVGVGDGIFYMAYDDNDGVHRAKINASHQLILNEGSGPSDDVRAFHDGYHPNADAWTTSRTLSLTGDVTGSVSWDGSGNASLAATVANDSHNHDGRYYTETEADGRFAKGQISIGSTDANNLTIQGFYGNSSASTNQPIDNNAGTIIHMRGSDANYKTQLFSYSDNKLYHRGKHGSSASWGSWQRVFMDNYHPNADKWTTSRTLTLSGEASGSVSWDGSANATLSVTLNDSALDNQYVTVGARHTGNADSLVQTSKASIRTWDVSTASDDPSGATDGLILSAGWDSSSWGIQQYHDFHSNDLYLRSKNNNSMTSWDRVFHDTYHPNADTLTTARTINGVSFDGSANITVADSTKLPLAGGTMTGTLTGRDIQPAAGYHLRRLNHHSGHLEGSYNNVAVNSLKTNPIYSIGSSYNPNDATLNNFYGIGFSKNTASFMTGALDAGNNSGWGLYVAADGDARIFLNGSHGIINSTGEHYVNSQRVFHDGYHPNADKWTTSRTLSLSGDASGSVSWDGSANVTLAVSDVDAETLDGKDHTKFGATLATYGTTGSSSGRIRCTAPFATNSAHMFQITVSVYSGYTIHTYVVGGYMYPSTNQWYLPTCLYSGGGNPDIVVGRDANGKAYISIANNNYTGVRVHNMTRGYQTTVADTYDPWTISITGDTENSVTPTISKVWHSTNDGTGSGLDADLLDGVDSSSFLRSDADDNVSAHTEWQDNKEIRLGNGADFRIYHNSSNSHTYFTNVNHGKNTYFQNEDAEGTNHAMIYMRGDTSSPYLQLFQNGGERLRTLSGGVGVTGLTVGDVDANPHNPGGLQVVSTSDEKIVLSGSNNPYIRWQEGTTDKAYIRWQTDGYLAFNNQESGNFRFRSHAATQPVNVRLEASDGDLYGSIYGTHSNEIGFLDDQADWAYRIARDSLHEWRINNVVEMSLSASTLDMKNNAIDNVNQINMGSEVILSESTDRADLLQITSSTSTWAGLQIRNSSNEGRWSFMTDGSTAGFYDDENNEWAVQMQENGGVTLYHNNVANFTTGATYLEMARHLDMNNYDIYGCDQLFHHGDTNTYMQFHDADQWRVVTGGTERLEVNNTNTTVANNLIVSGNTTFNGTVTGISAGAEDDIFWENNQAVTSNYTITNNKNAMSAGPITINSGVTVTIGDGEAWTVV